MPTNRRKRIIKRRVQGHNRAVVEKLVSGHWWEFLVPRDEDPRAPDEEVLLWNWKKYRAAILEQYASPWALQYFEGDYREYLANWERWIRDDRDREAVREGCYFDMSAADRVIQFLRRFCRHSKGQFAGSPFDPARWQTYDLIMPAYGWMRPDGTRRYRMAYVEVPKKNGKSTLSSGLSLYHLVGDREPGAEVYSAANDKEQAAIIFNEAKNMALKSPVLSQILSIVDSKKEIHYPPMASVDKALSSDVPTKEGLNISAAFVDELHAFRNDQLFKTLRYGGSARRQPIIWIITTAGEERDGICWRQHRYAENVLNGSMKDLSFLPVIYSADEKRDREEMDYWRSREAWEKANPALGETVGIVQMEIDCQAAQESPEAQADFKRYRLNIWGQKAAAWLRMDKWNGCSGDGSIVPLDFAPQLDGVQIPEALLGRECYAGLDMASRIDVAALVLDFPMDDGIHACLPFFWIPSEGAYHRQQNDQVPYVRWSEGGWMEMTSGAVIDYDVIRYRINQIGAQVAIKAIAVDRWNSTQLQTQLKEDGFEVIEFGQGYASMGAPSRDFEALVLAQKLIHGKHPVMTWMAGNVVPKIDAAGNIKPDKEASGEKIDGIVAELMGFDCANRLHEDENVYTDDLVVV